MQVQNLMGKIAVITGASSGIGEATARLLVKEGMNVFLAAQRKSCINALAEELEPKTIAIQTDVSSSEQVRNLDRMGTQCSRRGQARTPRKP